MARKRYQPEQIIGYLREAEVLLSRFYCLKEVRLGRSVGR